MVPQWGGVVFYNEARKNGNVIEVKMETVMPTIIRQLKLLLGLKEVFKRLLETHMTPSPRSLYRSQAVK